MECQNCKSPKESDEEYADVNPATAQTVTDSELLKQANAGQNWVCEYCRGEVRNLEGKCVNNCGAPRPPVEPVKYTGSGKGLPNLSMRKDPVRKLSTWEDLKATKWPIIGSFGLGVLAYILVRLFEGHQTIASVTSINWVYSATLQQKNSHHGSGWGTPFFTDTYNVACTQKYYGDKDCHPHDCRPHTQNYSCRCSSYDCHCHEKCKNLKNGYSKCSDVCDTCQKCNTCTRTVYDTCFDQCPVYKDYCEYDYYQWDDQDNRQTSGTTHSVQWPALEASGLNQRLNRRESYKVDFQYGEHTWAYTPTTLAEFQKYDVGDKWELIVRSIGSNEIVKEVKNTGP